MYNINLATARVGILGAIMAIFANKDGVDDISICSAKIHCYFNDIHLSSATGFYYEYNDNTYFVTNWHVLSGRNFQNGQPIEVKTGAIPNKYIIESVSIAYYGNDYYLLSKQFFARKYIDIPNFLQHGIIGQRCDIALFMLDKEYISSISYELFNKLKIKHKDKCFTSFIYPVCIPKKFFGELEFKIGDNCYIIGHPYPFVVQDIGAIWKRGSVATQPGFPMSNGLRIILVDASTSPGLSGSPVYISVSSSLSPAFEFIGVYSGRIEESLSKINLGIVWNRNYIDEIINDGCHFDFNITEMSPMFSESIIAKIPGSIKEV